MLVEIFGRFIELVTSNCITPLFLLTTFEQKCADSLDSAVRKRIESVGDEIIALRFIHTATTHLFDVFHFIDVLSVVVVKLTCRINCIFR